MYRLYVGGIEVGAFDSKGIAYREGWNQYNSGHQDTYLITPEGWLFTFAKHTDQNPGPQTFPTLRKGDKGDDVAYLQQLLVYAGFAPGPSDGIFGGRTETAVEAFQRSNGLVVDGIVGPQTWAALTSNRQSSQSNPLNVPLILQMPDLPRGCEVTSLAMVLNYARIQVDKMTLAQQIMKVPYFDNGYHGNPYDGFVGDMYSFDNPGYGAYHGPIRELALQYMPNQIVDLTGTDFDQVLQSINNGAPIWVITNATFKRLDPSSFVEWETTSGPVEITWHEHSVVVTGYDSNSIFINDPLDANGKNKTLNRWQFQEAWEQMGSQAITYTP